MLHLSARAEKAAEPPSSHKERGPKGTQALRVWSLTRHRLWTTGAPLSAWGGGAYHSPPPLSREPLVVESRARRHSKALHKTHQKHLSEFKN